MKVIGLDLGRRRCGVAVSDSLGIIAQPHSIVNDHEQLLSILSTLAREIGAALVVVGLPVGASGTDTEQTRWVRQKAAEIEEHLGLEVVLWDERLTTKEAVRRLSEVGHPSQEARHLADSASAAIILQSFLDANREEGTTGGPA